MIYLDFAKAFDKLDHGVLLHKLKSMGITGELRNWLLNLYRHTLFMNFKVNVKVTRSST